MSSKISLPNSICSTARADWLKKKKKPASSLKERAPDFFLLAAGYEEKVSQPRFVITGGKFVYVVHRVVKSVCHLCLSRREIQ